MFIAYLTRSARPRNIPTRMVPNIVIFVKNSTRVTWKHLQEHLVDEKVHVSFTVSNILHKAELYGQRPRKTPLLKDVHLITHLKFAREHVDKDNIF